MTNIERLLAIEEIKALKARYFRTMDCKDWAGLEAVFAPDLLADFRESVPERNEALLTVGAAKYVAGLAPILQHATTVHHGHTPEIEITSDTAATGIWAMEDKLWMPTGAPFRTLRGFGHYHETYVRIGEQWRIKTIRLTRLRVEIA
jgi:hypothetical protein